MRRYAFIDESGNDGMRLEEACVSSYYVVAAVVVNEDELPTARAAFAEIKGRQLEPMINRLQKARETVKRATQGRLDILEFKKYGQLKAAVDAVERFRLLPKDE